VFLVGFSGITLEILALFAYQVHFGSGYREVGILAGSYMAGLACGAALSNRICRDRQRAFRWVQSLWVIYPLGLLLFASGRGITGIGVMIVFFAYVFGVGVLGGFHFPLAVSFTGSAAAERAGYYYGLDLVGAALGALLGGVVLLPLVGLYQTCLILMILNAVPLPLILPIKSASQQRL
jgi:spermidine synthase